MKSLSTAVALLALSILPSWPAAAGDSVLLPLPAAERSGRGSFTIGADTPIQAGDDSAAAADAFIELLRRSGGPTLRRGGGQHAIRFVRRRGMAAEAYRLTIAAGGITVSASTAAGLYYGGVSLWLLLTAGGPTLAAREIADRPRFAWRGLMVDSARHYQPLDYLKQFVDWMALHKLNVLHWHLTDDQGWRIEIRHFPKLTAGGPFYRQDEIRDLVAYAAARQVTVLPEIEMPGHATAAIAAYPQWGVAPVTVTAPSPDAGVHATLFNVEDGTFAAIETILDEVMALFPGRYIHVGGDEAVKDQWRASAAVQARMAALGLADEEALQSWFIRRIDEYLTKHGRRLIGWDEILQGGLAPQAAVMSWRGLDGAVAAAKAGHDTVLSPWPLLYFDNRQAGGPGEPPGRGRIVSLADVYRFDPLPAGLSAAESRHVLGVQANLWSEHMRLPEVMTRMAWPRAAALAEIAWTPAARLDFADFRRRLALQQIRYRAFGLIDDDMAPPFDPGRRVYSQQLQLCSDKLALSLEDDAPAAGPRANFLLDILNPCWQQKQVDLTAGAQLTANVGQIPFRFQLGKDRDDIPLLPPRGRDGELVVRLDGCDGPVLAELPLTPAIGNDGVTDLTAALPPRPGRHDLCYRFTGRSIDPMWAINWIDLETTAGRP